MTRVPESQPSSPACLAHEADDAYMGFASRDEIVAFLTELLEAERAGAAVAQGCAKAAAGTPFAGPLHDLDRDAMHRCATLSRQLDRLGAPTPAGGGAVEEQAPAIAGLRERLVLLDHDQGSVLRKLRGMLPRVRDDALHRELRQIAHAQEIRNALLQALLEGGCGQPSC
ncbi:MAG: hypothetical protein JSR90_16005 [Proteobacteria bacterium]|nr:hypothetical protein [Pseudomonadota bacterium]